MVCGFQGDFFMLISIEMLKGRESYRNHLFIDIIFLCLQYQLFFLFGVGWVLMEILFTVYWEDKKLNFE